MKAPLSAEEQAMVKRHRSELLTTSSWLGTIAIGSALGGLLGFATGSTHTLRNVSLGTLFGVGVGFWYQTHVVGGALNEVMQKRRHKYADEINRK